MKTLLIKSIAAITAITLLVLAGIEIQEFRIKNEAEFVERAKKVCVKSDTSWIKLSGELSARSCKDFKIIS